MMHKRGDDQKNKNNNKKQQLCPPPLHCYTSVVIVAGVSGCGKSSVGIAVAKLWGAATFADADDYHPTENVEKMRSGTALNDLDRKPWLEALAKLIKSHVESKTRLVLACSALKKSYRDILRGTDDKVCSKVGILLLEGSQELIASRLKDRKEHFFNPKLLQSQFQTLEKPEPSENVLIVPIVEPVSTIARSIVNHLQIRLEM
mmetsp:Transcript_28309/g.39117  ORF Transcript_28309/g.39117 Transcript_28309/m.39117 type:complete len:203 (-) Transcript_28309:112-720(-)